MLSTDVSRQIVLPLANFASSLCVLASRVRTKQVTRLQCICGVLCHDVAVEVSLLTEALVASEVWALIGREMDPEVPT